MNSSATEGIAPAWPESVTLSDTGRGPPQQWTERRFGMFIVMWVLPCIITFGTVGNILAFVVLMNRRMRSTSVNFYLAFLACADTGTLYFSGFKTWLRVMTGFELLHVSDAGCKIVMFLFLLCLHMSAWLVVAVSVDRFLAVWFPFKSLTMCNVNRARLVGLAGFLIIAAGNSHVFWNLHLQFYDNGRHACAGSPDDYFMSNVFPWLKLATYSCVPFSLVLILNMCILVKIISSYHGISTSSVDHRVTSNRVSRESRVTTMLLVVSFTWLALTGPFTLWTFIATPASSQHDSAKKFLAKTACFLLMYINHGINFYLYCLTGNKFRQELRETFCATRSRRHGDQTSCRTFHSSVSSRNSRGRSQDANKDGAILMQKVEDKDEVYM